MRIVISGKAAVYPEPSEFLPDDPDAVPVTDPQALQELDGFDSGESCAEYLQDKILAAAGVAGGRLRFALDSTGGVLRAVVEYTCPRLLTEEELARLIENTEGQWSDGLGSNGFESKCGGGQVLVYPNPSGYPLFHNGRDLRVEQFAD